MLKETGGADIGYSIGDIESRQGKMIGYYRVRCYRKTPGKAYSKLFWVYRKTFSLTFKICRLEFTDRQSLYLKIENPMGRT